MLTFDLFPLKNDLVMEIIDNTDVESAISSIDNKIALLNVGNGSCFIVNAWRAAFQYYLDCYFMTYKLSTNLIGYTARHQTINAWYEAVLTATENIDNIEDLFCGILKVIDRGKSLIEPVKQELYNKEIILKILMQIILTVLKNGGFNDPEVADKNVNELINMINEINNISFPDYESVKQDILFLRQHYSVYRTYEDDNKNNRIGIE